jgi:amino acid transporter
MNYFKGLNAAYEFVMLLATMAALPPYIFVAAADILIARQQGNKITILNFIKNGFVPLLALLYSIYAVYCTGAEAVMWGFLLMLSGIPFYLFVKLRTAAKNSANNTSKK